MTKRRLATYVLLLITLGAGLQAQAGDNPPDPFDYNFCGGERVYPVIGVNLSTACGPRNQIALGRRGKLSWYFPATEGKSAQKGTRELTDQQLAELSLMAEVVQLADPPEQSQGRIVFKMGVNFTGRPYKRFKAALGNNYTPANALLNMMLGMSGATPSLPECAGIEADHSFDPTHNRQQRRALSSPRIQH